MIGITENQHQYRPGRDPVKRTELVNFLRKQIIEGVWKSGEVLPPRTWFEKEFKASPLTVQRSFEILINDRMLRSEGRHGTFVCDNLPHLSRYALVLYGTARRESMFTRTFCHTVDELVRQGKYNFKIYYDLGCNIGTPEHEELIYGVENQLFAGVFFAFRPEFLVGTPILTAPGMPRVAFMSQSNCRDYPGVLSIDWKGHEATNRALDYLKLQGKRRVAMLVPSTYYQHELAAADHAKLNANGLACPAGFYHQINPHIPEEVNSLVHLLFMLPPAQRPDALCIGDDNFLPHAVTALKTIFGDRAGEAVTITSHANFPLLQQCDLPVKYFGLNVKEVIESSVRMIDQLRSGETVGNRLIEVCESP